MRFGLAHIPAFAYELAPHVVASDVLESRLAPVYHALRLPYGQLEALTGVRERRFWEPGQSLAAAAASAGQKALARANLRPADIGMLIYGGVCRDQIEPAMACEIADRLGLLPETAMYDVSNACLGVLNGMVQVAGAIELGQVRAGLVVSAESAREVVDATIDQLLAAPDIARFRVSLATLTGGSGAVAVVVAHRDLAPQAPRLLGGLARSAPQHHKLCRWGGRTHISWEGEAREGEAPAEPSRTGRAAPIPTAALSGAPAPQLLETHAVELLQAGVKLGAETWRHFLAEMNWRQNPPERVICHQVGKANQDAILRTLQIPPERDFVTYPTLGNIGTVSLPITLAIAAERGHITRGQRVGLLGIASGINCLMLGVQW
jgi:3-oxoacyl-[acyl-carrier-protein] synthase-3